MEDTIDKNATHHYKAEMLFEVAEQITNISKDVILSKQRYGKIALVRNIIGYMLNRDVGLTTVESGKKINRDHSTIVYYGNKFSSNYKYYKEFRETYDLIAELFWSRFVVEEQEEIDLQVRSLQALIEKLKRKTEYLLIKNK
tara:strand:+ start:10655 stop:11080 length:426 start_codon:yes stop_codon:yes gene_type:complete